jgi:hypothetical protein
VVIWGLLPVAAGAAGVPGHFGGEPSQEGVPATPAPDLDGMLFVVGTEKYVAGIALDLKRLGATQAVATDGHLSPLLGTHGNLVISTYFALDPIQKYGFMAIPE